MNFRSEHYPMPAGKQINAEFCKGNLPKDMICVQTSGILCVCSCGCSKRWIMHDPMMGFHDVFTELEAA